MMMIMIRTKYLADYHSRAVNDKWIKIFYAIVRKLHILLPILKPMF